MLKKRSFEVLLGRRRLAEGVVGSIFVADGDGRNDILAVEETTPGI